MDTLPLFLALFVILGDFSCPDDVRQSVSAVVIGYWASHQTWKGVTTISFAFLDISALDRVCRVYFFFPLMDNLPLATQILRLLI